MLALAALGCLLSLPKDLIAFMAHLHSAFPSPKQPDLPCPSCNLENQGCWCSVHHSTLVLQFNNFHASATIEEESHAYHQKSVGKTHSPGSLDLPL